MESDNITSEEEKIVIKYQWIAFVATFVLFFVAILISMRIFGTMKYGMLTLSVPIFYIGLSSIKNRISVARLRGQKGYSRGTRAIIFGIVFLVGAVANIVIMLTPSLAERFIPF